MGHACNLSSEEVPQARTANLLYFASSRPGETQEGSKQLDKAQGMISEVHLRPPYTHVHPHNNTQLPIHYSLVGFIAIFESCVFRILTDSMQIALSIGGRKFLSQKNYTILFPVFNHTRNYGFFLKNQGCRSCSENPWWEDRKQTIICWVFSGCQECMWKYIYSVLLHRLGMLVGFISWRTIPTNILNKQQRLYWNLEVSGTKPHLSNYAILLLNHKHQRLYCGFSKFKKRTATIYCLINLFRRPSEKETRSIPDRDGTW